MSSLVSLKLQSRSPIRRWVCFAAFVFFGLISTANAAPQVATQEQPAAETASAVATKTVTVFLVRHTEKSADHPSDPNLNEAGKARAKELARLLGNAGVTHLFATQFKRTQQTLAPLAGALQLTAKNIDAGKPEEQIAAIANLPPGSTAVIAGHSDSIPDLAKRLGGELKNLKFYKAGSVIPHGVYDRLYCLQLETSSANAPVAKVLELRFGAVSEE